MKVAVYGAGAVGGYFGGRLARAGADVHLIARGPHLAALRKDGLMVKSVRGDFDVRLPATDDPAEVGPSDAVLFCVKSYDTEPAAQGLGPMLKPETAVVSLQNGIDNEEKIARAIGWNRVLGGAAYIFAAVAAPGVIDQTGGAASISFGEFDGTRSRRALELQDWCRKGHVDAEVSEDIQSVLWSKFVLICAMAGMTAMTRQSLGKVREQPEWWTMFRRLLEETNAVAKAEGVHLPPDLVDNFIALALTLPPDSYSSLYHDLVAHRRLELDALHGTVIRLARQHGLAVSATEAVYAALKPAEMPVT